jgi:NTP pyrophosphatase (non-canonical NTP hydrolase)
MKTSSPKVEEILDILQEECAEVIQSISKIRRFGIDNSYKDGGTQREHLVQELGDVTLLIELLRAHNVFSEKELHDAQVRKSQKLTQWSNIYKD